MTEEGDIGFSAYYVERNGEKVDLMSNERIQSHLMMEEGELLCIRPVLCKLNRLCFRKIVNDSQICPFGSRCPGI